jgi:diaminohydroxyphosphoribosylaminopyrimidine deaminase / 5-amino-6-(5-phosphoribosylamino)uracil reductase
MDVTELPKADERFMRVALGEAAKGLGKTSPNPTVGAIVVRNGKIIARAHHRQSGLPHAEIECLGKIPAASGARSTMFVTLEPCSTTGRTGPCTKKIIASGIKTVVVGAIDPNPKHGGRGITELREAGIEVRVGVLKKECAALNEAFNKWIVTQQPFVIAKCGMSLDGRLTRPPQESTWITNARARRDAHALRAQVDAILVGANTVRADNPRLTVRGVPGARQPWRVILAGSRKLPAKAHLFVDRHRERTLVYRNRSLRSVLENLGRKAVTSVLIEGGGDILGRALDDRLIDKIQVYAGAMFTGGPIVAFGSQGASSGQGAAHLERVSYARLGDDICITGYLSSPAGE